MSWADGIVRCAACEAKEQGVEAAMLPADWNALFDPGQGWVAFCGPCAKAGLMELFRASRIWARPQRWAYPSGIMSIYRPVAREVLLATPAGMASLPEEDAIRLRDAIDAALAMRTLAEGMAA